MPDYSLGKIYKVTCSQTNRIYIGSTVQKLNRRLYRHKNNNNECTTKDFIDPTIELIKSFPCETRNELLWEERRVMEENECVNKDRPITTKEERKKMINGCAAKYYRANKEHLIQKRAKYYNENSEELIARRKKKYHANKDEINAKRREKYKQKKQNSL